MTTTKTKTDTLQIIPLGGIGEIGKNMTAIRCGDQILVIDCGLAFPGADQLGVDLVIPDISYLLEHKEMVQGIILTHGHEDHIGSLAFVLKQLNVPVYGTRLTIGFTKGKLSEYKVLDKAKLHTFGATDRFKVGLFDVEPFRVAHSIPDAVGFAVHTPAGTLVHTGDFKFDQTPVDAAGHTNRVWWRGESARRRSALGVVGAGAPGSPRPARHGLARTRDGATQAAAFGIAPHRGRRMSARASGILPRDRPRRHTLRGVLAIGACWRLVTRRVRSDLAAVVGIVVLVALTVSLAIAVPAHIDATVDGAAREAVAAAGSEADLILRTPVGDSSGYRTTAEQVFSYASELPDRLPSTLSSAVKQVSTSVLSPEMSVIGGTGGLRVRIGVPDASAVPGLRVTKGELPHAGIAPGANPERVEIAVSSAAAEAAGIDVGDSLILATASLTGTEQIVLTVVGVVDVADASSQIWTDLPELWSPRVLLSRGKSAGVGFTVFSDRASFDRVAPSFPEASTGSIRTSFDSAAFDLRRYSAVGTSIDDIETSPKSVTVDAPLDANASSGYEQALAGFPAAAAAATAQLSTLAAGLLGVAVLLVVLSGAALARRRRPEVELLRSRGASLGLIAVHAGLESVGMTLLGTGIGVLAATALGFRGTSVSLVVAVACIIAVAPVVSCLRYAVTVSPARSAALRAVGAAALGATSITAVVALRFGSRAYGGSVDPLALVAPVLCATVVALAISPLFTATLRSLSSLAARTRGPDALLAGSSVRDGRSLGSLIALTLATSVAVTSLLLLETVTSGQEAAAWRAVGADVRVDGASNAAALVGQFESTGATAASITLLDNVTTTGASTSFVATVLAVDVDYSRLLEALPADQRPRDNVEATRRLIRQAASGSDENGLQPVPVLFDSRLARLVGTDHVILDVGGTPVPVTVFESPIDGPSFVSGPSAVVDRARLAAYLDAAAGTDSIKTVESDLLVPTTVLAVGTRVDAVADGLGDAGAVVKRSSVVAQHRAGALVSGVSSATTLSLLGTGLLAVLALLVTSAIGVRRRGRILALLGALGLPRRSGFALVLGELAPLVASGIVGGGIAAAIEMTAAGSAFGADILVGGAAALVVPAWLPVSILGVAAAALALAVLVDIPLSRRVRMTDILRTGEET